MSWIAPTTLFLVGGFAITFGFCEWYIARRNARSGGGDEAPPA